MEQQEQLPRGTKRSLGGGDVRKASGARRYGDYDAVYDDFVDEGGGGGSSRNDTGFLDENGSFVERAARGGTKEDAWLGNAEDGEATAAATKRARKALRKQEEDERLVDDLVASRAVFEIKKGIRRRGVGLRVRSGVGLLLERQYRIPWWSRNQISIQSLK